MRNTLKFLLGTICCAMMFDNCGYSMNDRINSINLDSATDDIFNLVKDLSCTKQIKIIPKISSVYSEYESLKQIFSYGFIEYIKDKVPDVCTENIHNEYYLTGIVNAYYDFKRKCKNKSISIKELANNLLRDNMRFISKYSPKYMNSTCLFTAAWNILAQYAKCKDKVLYKQILDVINKLTSQTNIVINDELFVKYIE